jgi:hypothetical protein
MGGASRGGAAEGGAIGKPAAQMKDFLEGRFESRGRSFPGADLFQGVAIPGQG